MQREHRAGVELARRAWAATPPDALPATIVLPHLVLGLFQLGEDEEAMRVARDMLVRAAQTSDLWEKVWWQAHALLILRNNEPEHLEEMTSQAKATLSAAQAIGNPTALRLATFLLGLLTLDATSDPAEALRYFDQSLEATGERGNKTTYPATLGYVAKCTAALGDAVRTAQTIRRGVLFARETGAPVGLRQILDHGGQALVTLGYDEPGTVMLSAATSGVIASWAIGGVAKLQREAVEADARVRLGEERFQTAVALGRSLNMATAIDYVLTALDAMEAASEPA
jgi:hypothetical protein